MNLRPWFLATLVAALTVSLGGLVWWQVERSHELMRQQVLAQAEQRSMQLADAMAGQVGGLLGSVDLALQQLRQEWDGDASRFDATTRAILGALPPGAVTHVSVVGADGYIVYNSLNINQRTYVGDREHFLAQQSGADRLVIGKPVLSRLGNNWTFIVNRPILRNGRFAGTMNMSVSSEYMSNKLAGLQLSGKDIIALLHADGSFMARSQDFLKAMGSGVPRNRPFLARGAPTQGVFTLPGTFDQTSRIYAWHRLDAYGLITAIGLAEDAVLAPLAAGMARDSAISSGLVALVAVFGGFIVLLLLRVARKQSEITANEAFRKRVFESSQIPIVVMDSETLEFIDCNPAASVIYGHASRAETLGKTPLDVSAPQQYDGTASADQAGTYIKRALNDGLAHFEWRHQRPDGEFWDAEVHLMSFQSDQRRLLQFTLQDITESKRTEAMLRIKDRAIAESLTGIALADLNGHLTYVNQAFLSMWGYTRDEEVLGRSALEFWQDPDAASQALGALLTQENWSGELTARNRTGTLFETVLSATLMRDDQGAPVHLMASFLDISERKRAEQELRASEASLREAQRIAKMGSWEFDIETGAVTWSDEVYRIHEIDPARFTPSYEAFLALIHPEDRERVNAAYGASVEQRAPYEIDYRIVLADARIRYLRVKGETEYRDGRPLRTLGMVHDITELTLAESVLREKESLLAEAQQVAHLGNWNLDLRSGKAVWSEEEYRLLGYDPGSVEPGAENFMQAVHPDDRDTVWGAMQRAMDPLNDASYHIEHRVVVPAGEAIVEERGHVTFNAEGQPVRMFGTTMDITERKRAEDALVRLNEELEQRVELRTVELIAAKVEAERASLAKSEFLSRMSHELRTPMNAILGFSQLLVTDPEHPLVEIQRDNVEEILGAGRHLLDLINEVLDLARIESGKFTISQEPVPLKPLIGDCLTLIRPQAEARGIRIVEAGRDCGEHVLADRVRLKQVLLNLLSNAVKYNRAQGTLSLVCMRHGDAIQIRISDSGAGLSAEQQARLFVAFERLDADKTAVEGTGIGLALSKRLVELMHGEIGVESMPGSGSTFWVRLPLVDGHAEDSHHPGDAASEDHVGHPVSQQRWDVLCIEDNPANLRLIERILSRRRDIRLLTAAAPVLGLELAQAHRPALILLDINLPDMDGYEVMQCLRESQATQNIPVVAISANAMPKDLARGKAAGFTDYLTKPLEVDRLLRVVDDAIGKAMSKVVEESNKSDFTEGHSDE